MSSLLSGLHIWDFVLLAVVTLQATVHAYVKDAQLKAFVYLLPFPFTAAVLAVGKPVDSANIWSLVILAFYTHCVRVLYNKGRVPIYLSIGISLLSCALMGLLFASALAHLQHFFAPTLIFWLSCLVILTLSVAAWRWMPDREDPGYRTPAPLWLKLPAIASVILCLILLKSHLGGLITAFPMVGTVAAYEARASLWTMSRQVTLLLPALAMMVMVVHFTQSLLGWPVSWALAASWVCYLPSIIYCTPQLREHIQKLLSRSRLAVTSSAE